MKMKKWLAREGKGKVENEKETFRGGNLRE